MKKVFIVFETDNWHSRNNREILVVTDSKEAAIDAIDAYAKDVIDQRLMVNDIQNLYNINQTQGYSGDCEFVIEEVNLNTIM